jgi:hypothetical protein
VLLLPLSLAFRLALPGKHGWCWWLVLVAGAAADLVLLLIWCCLLELGG